jgi:hypothetical protein
MDPLSPLTDADLNSLAGALCAGRLHAPFMAVSVRRYSPPNQAGLLADRL